jgi:hypothetical protein
MVSQSCYLSSVQKCLRTGKVADNNPLPEDKWASADTHKRLNFINARSSGTNEFRGSKGLGKI